MTGEKIHSHGRVGIIKEADDGSFSPGKKKRCYLTLQNEDKQFR